MNTISQIFPRTERTSGLEVGDGSKLDVPTTDQQNEKKKRVYYEAVDVHARGRLKKKCVFYEAVDAHGRRHLKSSDTKEAEQLG